MPKYVIERDLPGAGDLSPEQLHGIAQTSCNVLSGLGPQIQWVQSYVTADKIYCVYIAPNEDIVREHAQQGGFPAIESPRSPASSTRQPPRADRRADAPPFGGRNSRR